MDLPVIEQLYSWLQSAIGLTEVISPAGLFFAMTLLPLIGIPVSPFWIVAGILLGPAVAMLAASISLLLNISIGYWLAHGILRVPLSRWLVRRGSILPQMQKTTEARFIIMVRVVPLLPLFVQNYILGLAGVSFSKYVVLSFPFQATYAFGFVWFGYALIGNELWRIMLGAGLLMAVLLGMSIVRSMLQSRLRDTGATF